MDEENENASMERVVHMIVRKATRAAQECYLNILRKEEEGGVLALFAVSYRVILSFSEAEYVARNIQWTTCENFSVEKGLQQIEELRLLTIERYLQYSKKYHYRVLWSIPTRRKPIPQATASTYFVIEISKTKPVVSIQKPEHCRFREKWLKDVIENKIILRERLKLL
uniref:A-kinase anchoring protein 14 n=1 Tax=Coturnix japonica TaxID=93934 RepID=A0A8C2YG03_COTJA